MPTVIAATPNPALDLSMTVDKLEPHATHRIATAKRKLGGKGLNVANVCAEQGYQAVALGPLSSADKEAYADHPDTGLHTGVEAAFSPTPQPVRCTWAIYEKTTNATYILNEPGFEHAREVWDDVVARVDKHVARDPHSVVTVSGSLPPGTPPELVESLIAAAHRAGGKIIVDTSGPMLRTACRAGLTW
ncbi:hypothetical protein C3B44_09060 [Corynebacterium yudongzhengii]|uniref:Carbohydrate kinase PfkB domain-containing protein n=1 Tax=Corynebacterium yudongzhengii TaxID=2080740 RepID=A0A2U1T948_9CORY|nr:PfkB family carbohydrate kinase [Corynebacterium yudongzhengii]AWB82479.1 hypothetical protein C3B44_09060 [Corynebacterium yudongzhengii]PWC02465.1 hypothetical protein DF222_02210 [Corynebacterium yudongzhengii]